MASLAAPAAADLFTSANAAAVAAAIAAAAAAAVACFDSAAAAAAAACFDSMVRVYKAGKQKPTEGLDPKGVDGNIHNNWLGVCDSA